MAKMRLLTFMGMAVENKEISFDTMQQELQIGADDVEAFVIDGKAIRTYSFFSLLSVFFPMEYKIFSLEIEPYANKARLFCSKCVCIADE